jgi:hypothetical protein
MMSIARMSRTLRTVFEQDAVALARQAGLRQRTMSFTQLAYLLVLGWWNPRHTQRDEGSRLWRG